MPSAPSFHRYRLPPADAAFVRATVASYRAGAITRESALERLVNLAGMTDRAAVAALDAARKALVNPPVAYCAFRWASTSQGADFWLAYDSEKLSPEDTALAREALRRWIEIAERGASK